jgi:hypothetical protein
MEFEHQHEWRLPNTNSDTDGIANTCNTNSFTYSGYTHTICHRYGHTNTDTVVSAEHHGVWHADNHAAQLGLVQQRHGPHRQQLLESVQHELLRRLGLLQR